MLTKKSKSVRPAWILILAVVLMLTLAACTVAVPDLGVEIDGTPVGAVEIGIVQVGTPAPASAEPTGTPEAQPTDVRSTPISPSLNTSCGTWNTNPMTTNWLVPGASARGDVKADGVVYYDSGIGEGTTVRNMSSKPIEIYAEWGSGCEVSTDLKFLVNKDLVDGCGIDAKTGQTGCKIARIVTFTDDKPVEDKPYTELLP